MDTDEAAMQFIVTFVGDYIERKLTILFQVHRNLDTDNFRLLRVWATADRTLKQALLFNVNHRGCWE